MNSLILCEGSTDAILLSYYLIRVYGWNFCSKGPDHLNIKGNERGGETVNWYKRGDDRLLICGVGGKDKMKSFFKDKIYSPVINSNDAFAKIALVLDRDDKSIVSMEEHASHLFSPVITNMKNDEWIDNQFSDSFEMIRQVKALLLVIPQERQGALETLMLEAISEDPYDAAIVKRAKEFVEEMRISASRYVSSNRMQLKANLGVTWAVKYPEKVFSLIDEQIRSVPWEESEVLRSCFRQLKYL